MQSLLLGSDSSSGKGAQWGKHSHEAGKKEQTRMWVRGDRHRLGMRREGLVQAAGLGF